jgi:hypothetical protein
LFQDPPLLRKRRSAEARWMLKQVQHDASLFEGISADVVEGPCRSAAILQPATLLPDQRDAVKRFVSCLIFFRSRKRTERKRRPGLHRGAFRLTLTVGVVTIGVVARTANGCDSTQNMSTPRNGFIWKTYAYSADGYAIDTSECDAKAQAAKSGKRRFRGPIPVCRNCSDAPFRPSALQTLNRSSRTSLQPAPAE